MLNNRILRWLPLGVAMVLGTSAAVVHANVPKGWFLAGSRPEEFESGVDPEQMYQAHDSAFLKSKQTSVDGFGTLMQRVTAERYKGKRISPQWVGEVTRCCGMGRIVDASRPGKRRGRI